ncbi:thiamine phosphate synthase [Sporosarcina ureilytica]|uniref:Thiamine phosphate synthase/TenI domain-containing protein n=1 Tax=Sporosarcina ureilytica TaxID=298596 RepID=A0A1D8JD07_9BACL|nr:thiamine phosphate synthase [Sporosarcina ureilytica]AOV06581.1 hypothetical protein BI350_02470 [Sporosarcina ureilytica]
MKLIVVTNDRMPIDELIHTLLSIEPYIDAVILREKSKTDTEILKLIQKLKAVNFNVKKMIVHGNPTIASSEQIDKVQLPGGLSLPDLLRKYPALSFGKSIHSLEDAIAAEADGAETVLYGHLFKTNSKPGLQPRGTDDLRHIVSSLTIPVYAIGGILPSHIEQLREVGIAGVAVMSTIFESDHPKNIAKEYYDAIHT